MNIVWEWIKTHKWQVVIIVSVIIIYAAWTTKIFYCPEYNSLIAQCNIFGIQ